MKKFKKSPLAIACYVIAALLGVYFIYLAVTAANTVVEYYESYGMSAGTGEIFSYILQTGLTSFVSAVTIFMAGFILEEVRKINPANWTESGETEAATKEVATISEEVAGAVANETEEVAKEVADEADEVLESAESEIEEAAEDTLEFAEDMKDEVDDSII